MDYRVAQFLIRTHGSAANLVEAGIIGFRPFAVDDASAEDADMEVYFDTPIDVTEIHGINSIYEFTFEDTSAECHLCHYDEGYICTMQTDDYTIYLVKPYNSPKVECNIGATAPCDATSLRFGLWLMFGIVMAPLGGIAIHSSTIVKEGGAVLFLGESGTGKSTHTRLWRENIDGARLLNDDSPIIRLIDGVPTAFGSPWSGKTHCYHNRSFPIRGFVRLSQAPYNKIKRLPILNAIGALLPSCPPAFAFDDDLQDNICDTLSDMIGNAPVYHLECLPDAAAAQLSYNTVFRK